MKQLILLLVLPFFIACQTTDTGLVGAIRKTSAVASIPTTAMPISTPSPEEELKEMGVRDLVKPKKEKKELTAFEKAQAIQKEKMPKVADVKPKETLKTAQSLAMLRQNTPKEITKLPMIPKEGIKVASIEPLKDIPVATGKSLMTLRFRAESAELTEFEKARLIEFSKKSNLPRQITLKVGTDSKKKGVELLSLVNKRMQEVLALLPMSVKVNEIYSPDLEENTAVLEVN